VGLAVTRRTLRGRSPLAPSALLEGASHGAWDSVLLTDLSLANRFRQGKVDLANGATYLDYARSLPPGFVADALGWERPLERTRSPAWLFSDVSSGGCHVAIVPFLNFGWWGVFFVLGLYGWMLGRIDRWADVPDRQHRFTYAATFTFLPLWFWYGEMAAVHGAIIMALSWWAYRLATFLRSRSFLPVR
jgi:hypothetical protein